MASKRPATSSVTAEKQKKKRKSITLEIKLDIIKRYESGEGSSANGRALGLAQSTVATVLQKADEDFEDSTGGSEPSDTKPEAEALGGMPEGEEEAKGREEASAT